MQRKATRRLECCAAVLEGQVKVRRPTFRNLGSLGVQVSGDRQNHPRQPGRLQRASCMMH